MKRAYFLALALPALLFSPMAQADGLNPPGGGGALAAGNPTTIAGIVAGGGGVIKQIPGTYTIGSNYSTFAFGNNVQLSLSTDGTSANFAATLALINTSTTGGWGNALEVYNNIGGTYSLNTYINNAGIFYSTLNMVISGHYSAGANPGGHSGGGYAILQPNNYYQNMYACWADITGSCYQARNNSGAVGELSFSGQTHTGVFTVGIDAENSQFIWGATTITASGQVFTGDTFLARAAAANFRFGGADAAAPIAQTISFQNAAGMSNTAGVNTIFRASAGTGTGAGGTFQFQVAPPARPVSTQNAFAAALTIDAAGGVTIGTTEGNNTAKQLTSHPDQRQRRRARACRITADMLIGWRGANQMAALTAARYHSLIPVATGSPTTPTRSPAETSRSLCWASSG